jgi:hypothetical protein
VKTGFVNVAPGFQPAGVVAGVVASIIAGFFLPSSTQKKGQVLIKPIPSIKKLIQTKN